MPKSKKKRAPDLTRRRVYILGAGASASCGIAVAKDILAESITRLGSRDARNKELVHALLSYLYPSFNEGLRNYPNIEDFLNLLEMAKSFNSEEFIESSLWPKQKLDLVKNVTLKAVTDYLWERMQGVDSLNPMKAFAAKSLKHADTAITFNWDVTLERGLWDREDDFWMPYTYNRRRRGKYITILKPHGSIDWFRIADLSNKLLKRTEKLDDQVRVYPHFNFSKHPELAKVQPVIVPPLATKSFEFECLKKTWRSVYRAVADSTELCIVGYSLPKEDQFARLVLRRALRSNLLKTGKHEKRPLRLTVVNPDDSAAVTFTRLAASKLPVVYYQARLEDYVDWLNPWSGED
ncbi:MAG: hypothetical protein WB347_15745 [Terriglobales bacterium]